MFLCLCCSTASCCRDVGTSCLEGVQMTSPRRWTTGGRRSWASRCWGRNRWSFATHRPIRASRQTIRLTTHRRTCLCSSLDAFCTSQKMGRQGGTSAKQVSPASNFTVQQIYCDRLSLKEKKRKWLHFPPEVGSFFSSIKKEEPIIFPET